MPDGASRGTGTKLTHATIIVTGVASLIASLLSFLCVLSLLSLASGSYPFDPELGYSANDSCMSARYGFRREGP